MTTCGLTVYSPPPPWLQESLTETLTVYLSCLPTRRPPSPELTRSVCAPSWVTFNVEKLDLFKWCVLRIGACVGKLTVTMINEVTGCTSSSVLNFIRGTSLWCWEGRHRCTLHLFLEPSLTSFGVLAWWELASGFCRGQDTFHKWRVRGHWWLVNLQRP